MSCQDHQNDGVTAQPMLETTTNMPQLVSSAADESPSLPEELILEILLRVPVKSLLQFKCVSKSWKTLISRPQFAIDHLRTSSAHPNLTHQRLISSVICEPEIISFSLHSLFQNPSTPFYKASFFKTSNKCRVLGSCNGLLCLCDIRDHSLMLWNPSIRLTSQRFPASGNPDLSITFHGFGYDHVNDKYKLLVVEEDLHLAVTKIFTFGENSWKVIQNFPCCMPQEWHGKFVSGTFNWLTWTKRGVSDDDHHRVILSFDVRTETYSKMFLPPNGNRDSSEICNRVLNVLGNCLSLCFFDSKEACWVVWLMKEYGVQDSWTKFMKIPHFVQDPCTGLRSSHHVQHCVFRWYHSLDPVCISENGIVILKTNISKMVLYNSNDGRLYYPKIMGDHVLHHLHIYHESLVSPSW